MAIHYLGDIKHMTCQTENGQRRSPLSDISYNSGQKLTDEFTGRIHNRQHHDGTQIIDTDIVSADASCKYGDSSIKSYKRRNMMYNDLYRLNKKNSERIYWKTEIALSNELNDEQLKEAAREIALSFSAYLRRPIDYSIHKKPKTKWKAANNHIHLAAPERTYENGIWGSKSTSYYIDRKGNLIFDRNYKDEKGNDIRKPCTIRNAEPVYKTDPKTGIEYCTNQRRDKQGRLQWKDKDINALGKCDLKWMHNEIDRIQNLVLERHKINDKVKRNDVRTTKELKEAGIKAQHIGKRDMEKKGDSYQEKMMLNRRYDFFKSTFDAKYAELDAAEQRFAAAELAEERAEENCNAIAAEKARSIKEKENLQSEVDAAITDYIENELQPEEIFVKDSVSEFNKAIDLGKQNTAPIITTMNNGISAINDKINKFNQQDNPTDRETLIINYLAMNGQHMERYRNAADEIFRKSLSSERIQAASRKRWRKYRGWLTRNYINKVVGKKAAFLYEKYLRLKNIIKPEDQNPKKYIAPVTSEFALKSIINGGSVPDIKSRIRNNQTVTDNAVRITAENNAQYNKDAQTENHLPPPTAEPLTLWNTLPERMLQLTNEEKRIFYNPLPEYVPQKDQQDFLAKLNKMDTLAFLSVTNQQQNLMQIQESMNRIGNIITAAIDNKTEQERKASEWKREEYDRLSVIRTEKLDIMRSAASASYAETIYNDRLDKYQQYQKYQEIKGNIDFYKDLWEKQYDKEDEEAKKKSAWSIYVYEPDRTISDRYYGQYLKAKHELEEAYPDEKYPSFESEPNRKIIEREAKDEFASMRADLLKKKIISLNLNVDKQIIDDYDKAAADAQAYWKRKPADPNDPASGKQTAKTQTVDTSVTRRKANNKGNSRV